MRRVFFWSMGIPTDPASPPSVPISVPIHYPDTLAETPEIERLRTQSVYPSVPKSLTLQGSVLWRL